MEENARQWFRSKELISAEMLDKEVYRVENIEGRKRKREGERETDRERNKISCMTSLLRKYN